MPITVETFKRIVSEDDEQRWELRFGRLVEKPGMTMEHNRYTYEILRQLIRQLDDDLYDMRMNAAHLTVGEDRYFVADLVVIPMALVRARRGTPGQLEEYAEPMPFVVEVWSRSTGEYDVESKIPAYQQRGDQEIWQVHPYEHTATVWRRQVDGRYARSEHRAGKVRIESLGRARVDLDRLFEW